MLKEVNSVREPRHGGTGVYRRREALHRPVSRSGVASNFDEARAGTIGAGFAHYLSWKTVAPKREAEVAIDLDVADLSAQQRLVAGMLTRDNLLDIVRHYTLFMTLGGQEIKLVCRYPQFRGVTRAIERLKSGKSRREDGEADRRGGIVWHTQGSGKSLSMVFLVRKHAATQAYDASR